MTQLPVGTLFVRRPEYVRRYRVESGCPITMYVLMTTHTGGLWYTSEGTQREIYPGIDFMSDLSRQEDWIVVLPTS